MKNTVVIAEAGVNHNGSEELAFRLIDAAKEAGADIVKFQTFKASKLVTFDARQAEYQQMNTGKSEPQLEMLKRLELGHETHFKLYEYCKSVDIQFLSTAFDEDSLDFLDSHFDLPLLKVPSGELTNAPLLLAHARKGRKLILSTGMASLSEIERALGVIAFGLLNKSAQVRDCNCFSEAYCSVEGQQALKEMVSLLHCTTEYPAPLEDINLAAMETMRQAFNLSVGYSDHSEGITVPIAAVSKGAQILEKHFTLDRNMEGPDHKASLEPNELKAMIDAIRAVELATGNGIKSPMPSEFKNKDIARKSLVVTRDVSAGEVFDESMLTVKRPGYGKSPFEYWNLLGTTAKSNLKKDQVIL